MHVICNPIVETKQAPTGKEAHVAAADRIRAQRRVARIPCVFCRDHRVVCWVGSKVLRCAHCTSLGKTVNECGVATELWEDIAGPGLLMPKSSLLAPTDNSRGTAGGDAREGGKGKEGHPQSHPREDGGDAQLGPEQEVGTIRKSKYLN